MEIVLVNIKPSGKHHASNGRRGILPENLFPDRPSSERDFNEAKTEEEHYQISGCCQGTSFRAAKGFGMFAGMPPVNLFE